MANMCRRVEGVTPDQDVADLNGTHVPCSAESATDASLGPLVDRTAENCIFLPRQQPLQSALLIQCIYIWWYTCVDGSGEKISIKVGRVPRASTPERPSSLQEIVVPGSKDHGRPSNHSVTDYTKEACQYV
jgi:hypothetical protein